ncbi:MAG: hypothetical protein SF066_21890 [Thermoanaerobaculia bacterium]|nr:hypothetical protein [Thermoanaerobaculia bacterium]
MNEADRVSLQVRAASELRRFDHFVRKSTISQLHLAASAAELSVRPAVRGTLC